MSKTLKTYSELIKELDVIVQSLQAEELDVDDALKQYEEGLRLTKEIAEYLTKSENKLTQLRRIVDE